MDAPKPPSTTNPAPGAPPAPKPSAAAPNAAPPTAQATPTTPSLIAAMVRAAVNTSDLIFSPGRAPQVEVNGQLTQLNLPGVGMLTAEDTARIAGDLIGHNAQAVQKLKEQGSCDISYSLPKISRFRVNIFTQRGSCAIVMRVIPSSVPDFKALNLPPQLAETAGLRNGIVLVTGPTGSGKSSTLAAVLNKINEEKAYHIITIEDPIEFLHSHKRATIHQRELHSDTPSFALALRAALRQAPKVILVGEMRDKETIEVALEAAETGHLVFSTLHTTDASKTIERIIGVFPLADQNTIRNRLAKAFRYIISQRLIPRRDGQGRVAAFEVLKSTMRTREYVERGETEGKSLLDAMRDGTTEGMQYFDGEIEKLIRSNVIAIDDGLSYSTNQGNLRLQLADLLEHQDDIQTAVPERVRLRETEIEIER
jgi:twitching motility protein PilT